ncbi:MAG: metal ABC transporter permease [Lachnospiraceae bacterium]|jgi:zinc transport system permease protein|nr:metal ABC transporter permease [Lachnospiraceae bacterium]MBQ5560628.1 metal ABC transporter permease [Lachnospiraceae bacterium]MCR4803620.1 metal ABC transporter permease [Lachnospiraceae bacterium]
MFETIQEMMSYTFLARAVIVGSLVSLCAALLGVTLVLKRYSMIGDGLSHVGFGALAVASALNMAPLTVTIPVVLIASFFLLRLSDNSAIKGDSAIAIISSGSLAIGVVVTSMNGTNTDLSNYLFGSILSVSHEDEILCISVSLVVLLVYVLFYHRIFAITFDENFAKATGIPTKLFNTIISMLTAIVIVVGMRLMGTLLISSLIIFPSISAMRVFHKFKAVVILSAILSVVCFVVGITMSYVYELPSGASVVLVNMAVLLICSILGFVTREIIKK